MDIVSTLLCPVFSPIALTQKFPDIRKRALILVLFKGRSRCSIDRYRPISLMPKVSIIFNRIVFTFLDDSLKNKLNPKQCGFHSNKNSTNQLLDYIDQIYELPQNICCTVYFHCSIVFDNVPSNFFEAICHVWPR